MRSSHVASTPGDRRCCLGRICFVQDTAAEANRLPARPVRQAARADRPVGAPPSHARTQHTRTRRATACPVLSELPRVSSGALMAMIAAYTMRAAPPPRCASWGAPFSPPWSSSRRAPPRWAGAHGCLAGGWTCRPASAARARRARGAGGRAMGGPACRVVLLQRARSPARRDGAFCPRRSRPRRPARQGKAADDVGGARRHLGRQRPCSP